MKLIVNTMFKNSLRLLMMGVLASVVIGCGGGSSGGDGDDPEGVDFDGDGDFDEDDTALMAQNPDRIDANGDGVYSIADDTNGDTFIDARDVDLFAKRFTSDPNGLPGNEIPNCELKDCDSSTELWNDNASIAEFRSPVSTYALAIQRIVYCQGYGDVDQTDLHVFADAVYGEDTAAAVKAFQGNVETNAGTPNGIVDTQTWDALRSQLVLITSDDPEYMAYTISDSTDAACDGTHFYQRVSDSTWEIAITPRSTYKIPMSVNYSDIPRPEPG